MKALTAKQEAFAQAVASGTTQADAYRKAYQSARMQAKTVHERASQLAHRDNVRARIEALKAPAIKQAEETITVDLNRVIFEQSRIGFSDIRRLFSPDTGELMQPQELDDDTAAAIASLKVTKLFGEGADGKGQIGTVTEVKLWKKGEALDSLMKHLGGYKRDNEQKGDALARLPMAVLQAMERRLSELAEPRVAAGVAGGGAKRLARARQK